MKQSDIKAGKTYRGRDGKTRHVVSWRRCENLRRPDGMPVVDDWLRYQQQGGVDEVILLRTFARWAVAEVPSDSPL